MTRRTVDEALAAVLDGVRPLDPEVVPVEEAAGRVLAVPVAADRDQPAFDRSAMDGFAVRSEDVREAPVRLRVVGEVAAGGTPDRVVGPGEAVRIMTGAPVPPGADAVQMVEKTRPDGSDGVVIEAAVPAGRHIARQGEDIRAGQVALDVGDRLTTARLGLCWTFGAARVSVIRRPRVAILTTGDELVGLTETPGPTQIRDSNRATVGDLVRRAGAIVTESRIVRDDVPALRAAIRAALEGVDVLLLSGGVSAGDYDYVGECLEAEGVTRVFHKVHMKPGKPLWYGRAGRVAVFGLPGNPVSSMVGTRLFVRPVLRALAGRTVLHDPRLRLPCLGPFPGTGDRPTFQPAVVRFGSGVELLPTHGSGDVQGFARATALAALPARHPAFAPGDPVDVLLDAESLG